MNHYLSLAIYPEGTRSLSGQLRASLGSVHGTVHVLEMAAGQLWRLVLDSWGIAGIGLTAAALAACVAAVSLVAVAQMTSHVSPAGTGNAQSAATLLRTTGLKPGDQVAAASDLSWPVWVPQLFEITWTELQFFNPASQPPPVGVTVVEVPWQAGKTAQESWPNAPAGWRIVASDRTYEWVAWRAP
jgi:hypothetical protein